jgi:hypothetical protein
MAAFGDLPPDRAGGRERLVLSGSVLRGGPGRADPFATLATLALPLRRGVFRE